MDVSKEIYDKIATNLGKLRTANNKSQQEFADDIKIKRENYTSIENAKGERHLKDYQIIKLAKKYNVSADYILGLIDEPSSNVEIKSIYEKYGLTEKSLTNLEILNAIEIYSKLTNENKIQEKNRYSIIDTINILLSELPTPSGNLGLINYINYYINLYIDNNYIISILDDGEIQISNKQDIKNKKEKKYKKQTVVRMNADSQIEMILLKIHQKLESMRKEKQELNNIKTKN